VTEIELTWWIAGERMTTMDETGYERLGESRI
jgi:hypothetical protein